RDGQEVQPGQPRRAHLRTERRLTGREAAAARGTDGVEERRQRDRVRYPLQCWADARSRHRLGPIRRFNFQLPKTESISWALDRKPEIGEEIILGDRGVFRVVDTLPPLPGWPEIRYAVKRLRNATPADVDALQARDVNQLPPV